MTLDAKGVLDLNRIRLTPTFAVLLCVAGKAAAAADTPAHQYPTQLKGEALGRPIPANDNHRHFGKGQTETILDLPAGTYTLQLVLADWKHTPHTNPVMSEPVSVTVK